MILHAQKMQGSPERPGWFFCTVFLAIAANGNQWANSFIPVRGSILTCRGMVGLRQSRPADLPMLLLYYVRPCLVTTYLNFG